MVPIGIDPASGKETCIWINDDFRFVRAQNVRAEIESIVTQVGNCLIAWDAPISFSQVSYSDRAIDKFTRAWVKDKVGQGRIEKSAINALPFSGLSHWVISCASLGFPFGEKLTDLQLYGHTEYKNDLGYFVIEVHPAVSMGCMWLDAGVNEPFPVYKKSKDARRKIVRALSIPEVCIESDDVLDSYVAFKMASMFLVQEAGFVCSPEEGSYALPFGDSYDQIRDRISQ